MHRPRQLAFVPSIVVLGLLTALPAAADCAADPGNLISNCGFDADTAGWSTLQGGCFRDRAVGSSSLGSLRCDSGPDGVGGHRVVIEHSCLTGLSMESYNFGGDARVDSGTVTCTLLVVPNDGMACDGGQPVGAGSAALAPGAGVFAQSSPATASFGMGALSSSFSVTCTASAPFTIFLDDFFFGVDLVPVELQSFRIDG